MNNMESSYQQLNNIIYINARPSFYVESLPYKLGYQETMYLTRFVLSISFFWCFKFKIFKIYYCFEITCHESRDINIMILQNM